jgi:OmpA-OmpF porin, OOP family
MKWIMVLISALLICPQATAGDFNFEDTEEGIINVLSVGKTNAEVKTRSLNVQEQPVQTRSIKIVGKQGDQFVEQEVQVPVDPRVQGVNLAIRFDVNSYAIRTESYAVLAELGKALTSEKLQNKNVIIKGHTDSDGTYDYNLRLSFNRAEAVMMYLKINFGIIKSRMAVFGYGEGVPLVPNTGRTNKQLNRRVEIDAAGES